MSPLRDSDKVRVAVITGQHVFDVPAFHDLLRSMPGTDSYYQDLENYCSDEGQVMGEYDTLLFYNMHRHTPKGQMLEALQRLGETEQGIFLLHHALLAFREWDLWGEICGIRDRSFAYYHEQSVISDISDRHHAITRDMAGWEMVDETYAMDDADEDSQVLLTTDHPLSMRTLAWTRRFGRARVFCYAGGHDSRAYSNPHFRQIVGRGLLWAAGRI